MNEHMKNFKRNVWLDAELAPTRDWQTEGDLLLLLKKYDPACDKFVHWTKRFTVVPENRNLEGSRVVGFMILDTELAIANIKMELPARFDETLPEL